MTNLREFHGETYDPQRDRRRLLGQRQHVYHLMKDGKWRTLSMIAFEVGGSQAGVSARLRDFRKPQCGSHRVDRRYVRNGIWEYRLVVNNEKAIQAQREANC